MFGINLHGLEMCPHSHVKKVLQLSEPRAWLAFFCVKLELNLCTISKCVAKVLQILWLWTTFSSYQRNQAFRLNFAGFHDVIDYANFSVPSSFRRLNFFRSSYISWHSTFLTLIRKRTNNWIYVVFCSLNIQAWILRLTFGERLLVSLVPSNYSYFALLQSLALRKLFTNRDILEPVIEQTNSLVHEEEFTRLVEELGFLKENGEEDKVQNPTPPKVNRCYLKKKN